MQIEGEQAYPIYGFTLRWSQDCEPGEYKDRPKWTEGLPEGRFWNSIYFKKMFKEEQTSEQLEAILEKAKQEILNDPKYKDENIEFTTVKAELLEYETWHLTWFSHETFDVGQTNEEVLKSFSRFVSRKEALNKKHRYETGEDTEKYCLMGAEDKWRWRAGVQLDGKTRCDETPAPCRCVFCKEQGLLRIAH